MVVTMGRRDNAILMMLAKLGLDYVDGSHRALRQHPHGQPLPLFSAER
jgi:hypothetical protein